LGIREHQLQLTIKTFADGADINEMVDWAKNPMVKGFTTNPTLMRKSGVHDYETFAKQALELIPDLPLSLEVFADDFEEMERQALILQGWGANVYVKVPITNTKGESAIPLIKRLADSGVQLNVTAMMTAEQAHNAINALANGPSAFVSVFAGRIADTGRDPSPVMSTVLDYLKETPQIELIWASPREVYDIVRANDIGCHVITVTYDLLKKLDLFGKDLNDFSLETVRMFYDDASSAGYKI
jgi:transaldolase